MLTRDAKVAEPVAAVDAENVMADEIANARQSTRTQRASQEVTVDRRRALRLALGKGPTDKKVAPRRGKNGARALGSALKEYSLHASVADMLDRLLIPPAFAQTFPAGWGKLPKKTRGI